MLDFSEIENNLSGRIKSVLILALAAMLITFQGQIHSQGVYPVITSNITTELENPIDSFFNEMTIIKEDNEEIQIFAANIYLECWEQELFNGYHILQTQISNHLYPTEYVEASQKAFLEFMESESWMKTYYEKGEDILNGSTLTVERLYNQADLIRQQVLRIYTMLGEYESGFIFNDAETENIFKNRGFIP